MMSIFAMTLLAIAPGSVSSLRFTERFTGEVLVNQSAELQGSVPITFIYAQSSNIHLCTELDFHCCARCATRPLDEAKYLGKKKTKTTQIVASGSLAKRVKGGTYTIQVKQTLFPYTTLGLLEDAPICEERELPLSAVGVKVGKLTWEGLSCPLSAGKIVAKIDMELSGKLPTALASTKTSVTAKGPRGEKLLCVTIESKR
jgi:hypothetical protein